MEVCESIFWKRSRSTSEDSQAFIFWPINPPSSPPRATLEVLPGEMTSDVTPAWLPVEAGGNAVHLTQEGEMSVRLIKYRQAKSRLADFNWGSINSCYVGGSLYTDLQTQFGGPVYKDVIGRWHHLRAHNTPLFVGQSLLLKRFYRFGRGKALPLY